MTTTDARGNKHDSKGLFTEKGQDPSSITSLADSPILAGLPADGRTRLQQILDEAEQSGHDVADLRAYLGGNGPTAKTLEKVSAATSAAAEAAHRNTVVTLARDIADKYAPGADRIEVTLEHGVDDEGRDTYYAELEGFTRPDGETFGAWDIEQELRPEDADAFNTLVSEMRELSDEDCDDSDFSSAYGPTGTIRLTP